MNYVKSRTPVLTKSDFVKRYQLGEFGNASPTWDSLGDIIAETYPEIPPDTLYHVRNRIKGGKMWYNVRGDALEDVWYEAAAEIGEANLYISEMAPTNKTLLQGEVTRGPNGLELTYSTLPLPMREALAKGLEYCHGLLAKSILETQLNTASYEWLMFLLDSYPSHVIEFSAYSVCWGTVAGHNAVIWECRLY